MVLRVPTYPQASRLDWPTPLAAFLRRGPWIPIETSGSDSTPKTEFRGGEDVWLGSGHVPALPAYLPQFSRAVHSAWSPELAAVLVQHCHANVLNTKASLPRQVGYMADLLANGEVDEYSRRTFLNAYSDAWHMLAREVPGWTWQSGQRPAHLIVRRRDVTDAVNIGDLTETVYVRDSDDTSKLSMVAALGKPLFDAGAQSVTTLAALVLRLLESKGQALSKVPVTLLVDGSPFAGPTTEDPVLAEQSPWLAVLLVLAMESQRGAAARRLPLDRSVVIDRFQRVRIRFAQSLGFEFEGSRVAIPPEDQGAMPVRDQARPLVLVEAQTLDWPTLVRVASPVCELIGHADLAQAFILGMRTLQRLDEQVAGPLPTDRAIGPLSQELKLRECEGLGALALLDSNAHRLIALLEPLVQYFSDDNGLARFLASSRSARTIHELRVVLEALWPTRANLSAEDAITACQRARTASDLQQDLDLDFARFNVALTVTGYDPITYPELHEQAVASYIERNRDAILDRLRSLVVDQPRPGGDLSTYIECRASLRQIQPPDQWLPTYPEPPEALISALVNAWLMARHAVASTPLPAVSHARPCNRDAVNRLVQQFGRLMGAWCRVHASQIPAAWITPEKASVSLLETLDARGALDFEVLDEERLVAWLRAVGQWPNGMPHSTSLEALGISESDLNHDRQQRERERAEREKHERSVEFRGRLIDPNEADHNMVSAEIAENISKTALKVPLGTSTNLQPAPAKSGASRYGTGGSGGGRRHVPEKKTDFIGFLGECAVYHWLRRQLNNSDIDESWKSEMRSRILPGLGNDGLGYDFSIRFRRKTWLLEVKSSIGDPMEFEMGESEVRAAMASASSKDTEYRIVYVSGVLDPSVLRIDVLPNPWSAEGRPVFQTFGQGWRYGFRRPPG
jgi:hypothetical protein